MVTWWEIHRVKSTSCLTVYGNAAILGVSIVMGVATNHPFDRIFPYKPAIWGYPHLWKRPYLQEFCLLRIARGNICHAERRPTRLPNSTSSRTRTARLLDFMTTVKLCRPFPCWTHYFAESTVKPLSNWWVSNIVKPLFPMENRPS